MHFHTQSLVRKNKSGLDRKQKRRLLQKKKGWQQNKLQMRLLDSKLSITHVNLSEILMCGAGQA